ncbi:hypothetical protein P171DRAFT_523897 [Karstenula rhodostoma CBS 690.94]|uniref:Uncharacterized protein n=1 Tax=Karstenula rhodostoma CBS 690.94 TaxID=1392251 RepID=A0A9P4PCI6_9PLEO|nr:hypothetical protein P171DRAFT_523897 [Karstenula rhodostoma CBS 690.94]
MGKVTRFVRKVTGRAHKHKNGHATMNNVGVPRTVAVPSFQRNQSPLTGHPFVPILPSDNASSIGPEPVLPLPTLAPIKPVSPIRLPTAVRSTSPAPKFSLAEQNEYDDDSHTAQTSTEDESFYCQGISAPLKREDTTYTIFHPPTPPSAPRLTSASFARLPEYVGSSDGSEDIEVPRTGHGTFHSDVYDSELSDTSGMLRPLEFPAQEEDVFSSSSSPDQPSDRHAFALPGPPSYHRWPLAEGATPSRPSYRSSSVHMLDAPTPQRGARVGSTQKRRGRSSRHRRPLKPYPVDVPHRESSPSIQETEHQAPRPRPTLAYLPPPTPSSELVPENSFTTRAKPLPSSTPTLPRSDDYGIDLQEVLLSHVFFPDVVEHSSVEDKDDADDTGSEENWVEYVHERTSSEQADDERAKHEDTENIVSEGNRQTWWENVRTDQTPQRNLYDRSGARGSFGFRRDG